MNSPRLDLIIADEEPVQMQVVFLDIEKYSQRKPNKQRPLLKTFMRIASETMAELAAAYPEGTERQEFMDSVVKVMTGDGALRAFTASSVCDDYFAFAKSFIRRLHQHNTADGKVCPIFEQKRYCDCHDMFYVRIGMSEGPGDVFIDDAGKYNIAGGTVNMAARIMDLGDGMHILMSDLAFRNLVDWEQKPDLEVQHRVYRQARIKHGLHLDVYQYLPKIADGINVDQPAQLRASLSDILSSEGVVL
jgi:class 3 adenylate cyclase